MSLTVRFPNGNTVVYNSAAYLMPSQEAWRLYSADPAKGGYWIASIQPTAGVIVEAVAPCNTTSPGGLNAALKLINSALETRHINGEVFLLKKTKNLLRTFNSVTGKMK